jgi:hypothetical protein
MKELHDRNELRRLSGQDSAMGSGDAGMARARDLRDVSSVLPGSTNLIRA